MFRLYCTKDFKRRKIIILVSANSKILMYNQVILGGEFWFRPEV